MRRRSCSRAACKYRMFFSHRSSRVRACVLSCVSAVMQVSRAVARATARWKLMMMMMLFDR